MLAVGLKTLRVASILAPTRAARARVCVWPQQSNRGLLSAAGAHLSQTASNTPEKKSTPKAATKSKAVGKANATTPSSQKKMSPAKASPAKATPAKASPAKVLDYIAASLSTSHPAPP